MDPAGSLFYDRRATVPAQTLLAPCSVSGEPVSSSQVQERIKTIVLHAATVIVWGGWALLIGYWIYRATLRLSLSEIYARTYL
jgi:hypothetical protein